jgi:hypothetical protein
VKVTIRTAFAAVGGGAVDVETAGADVGPAVDVVAPALVLVVEAAGGAVVVVGVELLALEQAASITTAPIAAMRATRVRDITRS